MIVPVQNDHAIVAEHEPSQLRRGEHSKRMPGASDGSLHHGKGPRIVRLEYGVVVRCTVAVGEGVVNGVISQRGKVVWPVTKGYAGADQQPGALRAGWCWRGRRRVCCRR